MAASTTRRDVARSLWGFLLLLATPVALQAQIDAGSDNVETTANEPAKFHVVEKPDRLVLAHAGQPVADFVFRDEKIRRPHFANVHAPGGLKVTRHNPPIVGVDAVDHDTMHPGIWLAFGDISGSDFWRNKATVEHVRFVEPPTVANGQVSFASESCLRTAAGDEVCRLTSHVLLAERPSGWLLIWDATFHSDDHGFSFGDQEEMGFGARVATSLTEKNGGSIVNSNGLTGAAKTWGQPAAWCDYSGTVGDQHGGITLMAAPSNFRVSWWHNRDYGLSVANPFGRAAMKQGAASRVDVPLRQPFRICFAAVVHDAVPHDDAGYKPAAAYQDFVELFNQRSAR